MGILNKNDVEAKIQRLQSKLKLKSGQGYEYSVVKEGRAGKYKLYDIKDIRQFEDEIHDIIKWIYAYKDYLKKEFKKANKNPNLVERCINDNRCLGICADLANDLKHGGLKDSEESRSGLNPNLVNLKIVIPQKSIEEIAFIPNEIHIFPKNVQNIDYDIDVIDAKGNRIDSVLNIFEQSISLLEELNQSIISENVL